MAQFQYHPLAFGIVLIVAGSIVGMLIHELGDLIEKGLWLFRRLDPKTYAALAVTLEDSDQQALKNHTYKSLDDKLARCFGIISMISAIATIFAAVVLLPCAVLHAAHLNAPDAWFRNSVFWGLLPLFLLVISVVCIFRYKKISKKISDERDTIDLLRTANPYIQTKLVGKGNESKRTLFDGWRFVMRNLILTLAISNLICLWKPLDLYCWIAPRLIGANNDMTFHLTISLLIVSCVLVLMLIRYYHYAYLRYKYSLENYINLPKENEHA